MIDELIRREGPSFGVTEVRDAAHLSSVTRTAYASTQLPGTLCLAVDEKYFKQAAANPNIAAIVAPLKSAGLVAEGKAVIFADRPDEFFYFLHNQALHTLGGVAAPKGRVAASAKVASTAVIAPSAIIEDDVEVRDHCVVGEHTTIGAGSVLHPGVMVGMAGSFGKWIRGRKEHLQPFGGVRIGRRAVLLAGAVVVRAINAGEFTEIGEQVYVGIGASIGHDTSIGAGTDVSAKAIIAGRVRVGANCWIGAGAIVSNGLTVGDGASVRIGSVVIANVPAGGEVSGNFALDHRRHLLNFVKSK